MRMKLRRDIYVKFEKRHEFTKQISIGLIDMVMYGNKS